MVRGGFVPDLRMDATVVANASWLRAVLWAFLFALREEAIEQIGEDPFPLLMFDDPQATFDVQHRHRWARYVADLQKGPSNAQIVLATYDETFLDLIKLEGVTGREALMRHRRFGGIDETAHRVPPRVQGPSGVSHAAGIREPPR